MTSPAPSSRQASLHVSELASAIGQRRGPSSGILVTQERVNQFADATDDHQWIHVDPVRAADGPFGGTIAHGYLTLALLPSILRELLPVTGYTHALNYGLNKCRFPATVKVGATVFGFLELMSVSEVAGGVEAICRLTIEAESDAKPACVAEVVLRYLTKG